MYISGRDQLLRELAFIQEHTGANDRSECMRRSVHLAFTLFKAESEGNSIHLEDMEGNRTKVLIT